MRDQTFVRRARERWGLSQEELAKLLGITQSTLSRFESGTKAPDLEAALGLQVIFGRAPHQFFPGVYRAIEEQIMQRAAALDRLWGKLRNEATSLKIRLLSQMVGRVRSGYNCA